MLQSCQVQASEFTGIQDRKVELIKDLKGFSLRNKDKIGELLKVDTALNAANGRLEEEAIDARGEARISAIKKSIGKLKKDIFKQSLREGLLRYQLEKFKLKHPAPLGELANKKASMRSSIRIRDARP